MRAFILTLFSLITYTLQATEPPSVTEPWSKAYLEFREIVNKVEEQVTRNYLPEIMIIREGHTIASIQIDAFAAKVLREADEVLLPYRQAIQNCVEANHNEYRTAQLPSYEYFGWFLDNYVRTLVKSLGGEQEPAMVNGVRSRKVTTDRALYAFSRLLTSYLDERGERLKQLESAHLASDREVASAIDDIARRVFRLDLTQKFDRKEAVEKGLKSQPVLRDLASNEGGADLSLGMDPITRLMAEPHSETTCKIALPPRGKRVATSP